MRLIILLILGSLSLSIHSQGYGSYIEINSYSPQYTDFEDLDRIKTIIGDRKLIAIGESTHGTKEFALMRHRFIKYLANHHQYSTIIIEADHGAVQNINNYVLGYSDSESDILDDSKLWPWRTEETIQLVKWVRKYNSRSKENQIKFVGSDMQTPQINMKWLEKKLEGNLKDSLLSLKVDDHYFKSEIQQNKVKEFLLSMKRTINNEEIVLLINPIIQYLEIGNFEEILEFANYRDKCMARNILEYLKLNPHSKSVFLAHNAHIANHASRVGNSTRKTAGWYLKNSIGKDYFCIAQDFYRGDFNSERKNNDDLEVIHLKRSKRNTIGKYFHDLNSEILFALQDWIPKKIEEMNHIGSRYVRRFRYREEVKFYDAFIFIDSTTETTPID